MASFNQIKSTLPFEDDDAFLGHDHLFGSFNTSSYDTQNDAIFGSHSPSANGVNCGGLSPEENEKGFIEEADSEGPILPPPSEIIMEECFAVREWRRKNEIRIEENEKREKEILSQILSEADDYKVDFYNRRKVNCETNRKTNREKEKVFLAKQEKFYAAAADKNYWKAISELIPNEVPAIEKKKGKKDEEKKLSISVVQGPKPGKPTDLTRMRQLLLKLKHNTPDHLNPSTPTPPEDSKASTSTVASAPLEATA